MTDQPTHDFQQDSELTAELISSFDQDTTLHRYALLLHTGIRAQQSGGLSDEETNQLISFLCELRQSVEDGSNEAPESLAHAESLWGHFVSDSDLLMDSADDWSASDQEEFFEDESEIDASDELDAPSAEQIQSLMAQMQGSADRSPEPTQASESFAQNEPERIQPTISETPPVDDAASGLEPEAIRKAIASLDAELCEAFLEDAVECVGSMESALLKLESEPSDQGSIQQILRELHTIKGASASVGLTILADQMHALEDQLREDQQADRKPDINQLLKSVDAMSRAISNEPEPEAELHPNGSNEHGINAGGNTAPARPATPNFAEGPSDDETVRVKASQLNRLMDMLAELVMLRNRRDTELQQLQEVYHELIGSVSKMRLLSNEERSLAQVNSSLQLSEVANDVLEVAQNVRDCARPVAEGNSAVSQFIRQFRQELVELRRTPISGLFQRLQRAVRDAAQAESKEVELKLIGQQAGIERTLQQRLYEPLLHIVRNSVCHGIESVEQRRLAGKPEKGVITIEAQSGPDLLVIEIRDDGQGLDYDAIRRRGIERGLISSSHAASEDELAQLIFQPGFSTRQETNQVAGRGVGMDVVASTLQRLRGWLEVDSVPGQGTRIRLNFPLPSLVQHAMVFRAGPQLFALPMQSVQSAGGIDPHSLHLRMSDLIADSGETDNPAVESSRHRRAGIVLADQATVGDQNHRVTLIVDEIVGPEEVVVRPLPALLKQHPFCSGATLSGTAQTVLLLDARQMVESETRLMRTWEPSEDVLPTEETASDRITVLVADDSLSARRRVVRSLSRYPVDIVEVGDGKQALQKIQAQEFAAVFSDMEMPHLSGMDLLSATNELVEKSPPPVIIISSRNEPEFTDRARELGAVDYLIKPLTDEALDHSLGRLAPFKPFLAHEPNLHTSGVNA